MPALPPLAAPAGYVPFTALAVSAGEAGSVAVGPGVPLPVAAAFGPAASSPLSGSASASTVAGPFLPELGRPIWLTLSGAWSGTVQVKRSVDGGATLHPVTAGGEAWGTFAGNACEPVALESSADAAYYLDIALISGSLDYEVAQ